MTVSPDRIRDLVAAHDDWELAEMYLRLQDERDALREEEFFQRGRALAAEARWRRLRSFVDETERRYGGREGVLLGRTPPDPPAALAEVER